MRTNLNVDYSPRIGEGPPLRGIIYRLGPAGGPDDGEQGEPSFTPDPVEGEDLPYKVELWDEDKASVETVLAVTVNGSIGFAAFYAATREFAHRYITLRHKSRIVSRWNGPQH
jgi:hypothetical protein